MSKAIELRWFEVELLKVASGLGYAAIAMRRSIRRDSVPVL